MQSAAAIQQDIKQNMEKSFEEFEQCSALPLCVEFHN
jgi:hypothetical protein